jgi:integrase
VFSTTGRTQVSGYSRAKENLDIAMLELMRETNAKAELVPFRIHDLRRTAASGMAALGFQPHIIERVLNHVSGAQGGLVGVYQRHEYFEERKRALEAWGSYIAKLLANEQGSEINVLKFRIRG